MFGPGVLTCCSPWLCVRPGLQHAFVEAGVRHSESDRTAFVAFPGGVGSLDEVFEVRVGVVVV